MTAAIQSGAGRQERPQAGKAIEKPISGSFLRALERHATLILVLTVILSAGLLWGSYGNISGLRTATVALEPSLNIWLPAYSLKTFVTIAHVLGLAMSFGAVMFLDLYLLRYLLFRPVPSYAFEVASFGSWLVIAGLCAMWLTGLAFLLIYWAQDPVKLDNPKLLAKVVVVAVLSLNGILIHNRILPMLKNKVGRKILEGETPASARLIIATAAVSLTSWTFALVLGLSQELNFTVSGASLLLVYALLNAAVFMCMKGVVSIWGSSQSAAQDHKPGKAPQGMVLGANLRTLL